MHKKKSIQAVIFLLSDLRWPERTSLEIWPLEHHQKSKLRKETYLCCSRKHLCALHCHLNIKVCFSQNKNFDVIRFISRLVLVRFLTLLQHNTQQRFIYKVAYWNFSIPKLVRFVNLFSVVFTAKKLRLELI